MNWPRRPACTPNTSTPTTEQTRPPIDLDIHRIPANPARGEPEHWHFDFRYLHRASAHGVHLQTEEVTGHAWRSPAELPAPRLAARLAAATG